jgi:hypothetical protein
MVGRVEVQNLDIQAGGLLRDWATPARLTTTVLIPLPLPSILD